MRHLTEKEVEKLFEFTRKHYVEFYDLQCEFVDHLANDIENQWEENEQIPFRDALQIAFKKFGVFGFSDLVKIKSWNLEKRYYNLIWNTFLEQLNFFIVIGILAGIYLLKYFIYDLGCKDAVFITFFIGFILLNIPNFIRIKNYRKFKKKYLYKEVILRNQSYAMFIILYINHFVVNTSNLSLFRCLIDAFILMICVVIYVITNHVLPKRIENILQEEYGDLYKEV